MAEITEAKHINLLLSHRKQEQNLLLQFSPPPTASERFCCVSVQRPDFLRKGRDHLVRITTSTI